MSFTLGGRLAAMADMDGVATAADLVNASVGGKLSVSTSCEQSGKPRSE